MNGFLLGGACLGALVVFLTSDTLDASAPDPQLRPGEGSMTREISVDPETGEITETNIIAFVD